MTGSQAHPLLAIDFVGAAVVGTCVCAFGWLAMVQGDDVSGQIADLTQVVETARQDLAGFRSVRDRQRVVLSNRQAELATTGRLPDQAPVESYFLGLSTLATQHRLKVRSQYPLGPRQYPGLLEQRYVYELNGTMPDITRFLRGVEGMEFWADIGFLKVERMSGAAGLGSTERAALLTISLFSALPMETDSDEG